MSGHSTKGRWRISGKTNAVAVMGGCDMDLRRAEIEGPEVEITAVAFWGGIDIIVPEGFDVELRGFSFMGGRDLKLRDVPIVPGSPRIVVRGFAVMGGIDVKSRPNRSGKRLGTGRLRPTSSPRPTPSPTRGSWPRSSRTSGATSPADGTVTILFCDMVDYAGMTERLGDQASREVLREHHRIVRDAIARHGGREISVQGDGFMVAFGGVARALRCAIDIQRAFHAHVPADDGEPIAVHIGVHTGDAVDEGDDYLGHTVIVASRLADAAGAGEILVSSLSEQLVQGSGEFTFDGHRETQLKGMARAQPSATLAWARVNGWIRRTPGATPASTTPHDPGAAERLALLEYLTERGATIEQMVRAHRMGTLPGVAGDLVTQGRTAMVTVADVAARSGLPASRVMRVLLAAGIPARSETEVPADLASFMAAFEQGAALMGEEAILAFTRVLGAAANNVAEAAVALFFAELGPGTVREGPDELARAQLAEAATTAFTSVPDVLALLVMDAFERAQRRAEAARSWLGSSPPADDQFEGPTEVVALGFVDLVGSTAWAQTLPLRDQSLALSRFESAAWTSAVLAGGRVVKTIGDEVFFAAPTAEAACRIGLEVCRAAAEDEVLPPARGAVGIGLATPREGDYFGPLVNLLSRLVKAAAPGGVVVTEAWPPPILRRGWVLRPLEPTALRGIDEPVRVFVIESAQRSD